MLHQQKVTMSAEVKNYLLDGSPSATFTMVSHEEIRVAKNVTSAQNLMKDLEDLLKEYSRTNMTDMEQVKAPTGSQMETLLEQVKSLNRSVSLLTRSDALLKTVSTSHRDRLQARLFGLFAEVKTIVKDWLKQHDKKFCEPATSSQPSS